MTGNAEPELQEAARCVVEWAAANVNHFPNSRVDPGQALLKNMDCHFGFEEAKLERQDIKYALPMAVALYCALTGATARTQTMLTGEAGPDGLLRAPLGASKKDVEALDCAVSHLGYVDTIVMEEGAQGLFDAAIAKHGSDKLRSNGPRIVGVKTFLDGIRAAVEGPVPDELQPFSTHQVSPTQEHLIRSFLGFGPLSLPLDSRRRLGRMII
jgi:hypothetical protein